MKEQRTPETRLIRLVQDKYLDKIAETKKELDKAIQERKQEQNGHHKDTITIKRDALEAKLCDLSMLYSASKTILQDCIEIYNSELEGDICIPKT